MQAKVFVCDNSTVVNIQLPKGTTQDRLMEVVELLAPMEAEGLLGRVSAGVELNAIASVPARGMTVEMAPGATVNQAHTFISTLAERAGMTVESVEELVKTPAELRAWWASQQQSPN